MKNIFESVKAWYRGLPDKKRYFEVISAFLTIPVLLTVVIMNIRNLSGTKVPVSPPETPAPAITVIPVRISDEEPAGPAPTPVIRECESGLGNASIASPEEGDIVDGQELLIDITYNRGAYCSAVWSYRLSGGPWSDYSSRSFVLYGVSPGEKLLEVRVKSLVSDDEVMLARRFTVLGPSPTLSPSPSASPSAQPSL